MSCLIPLITFCKRVVAAKDYEIDWAPWLGSDTINSSVWTVPAGISKGPDFSTDTTVTVWISGGTTGESYTLTNTVTTAGGLTEAIDVVFKIV